jgi:hypothetical protein
MLKFKLTSKVNGVYIYEYYPDGDFSKKPGIMTVIAKIHFANQIRKELPMKEYEIVAKFLNGCAGEAYPQTFFEEAELSNTDDFVRTKHGKDFDKFIKELLPDGRILYTFDNGTVRYIYEFTEL